MATNTVKEKEDFVVSVGGAHRTENCAGRRWPTVRPTSHPTILQPRSPRGRTERQRGPGIRGANHSRFLLIHPSTAHGSASVLIPPGHRDHQPRDLPPACHPPPPGVPGTCPGRFPARPPEASPIRWTQHPTAPKKKNRTTRKRPAREASQGMGGRAGRTRPATQTTKSHKRAPQVQNAPRARPTSATRVEWLRA